MLSGQFYLRHQPAIPIDQPETETTSSKMNPTLSSISVAAPNGMYCLTSLQYRLHIFCGISAYQFRSIEVPVWFITKLLADRPVCDQEYTEIKHSTSRRCQGNGHDCCAHQLKPAPQPYVSLRTYLSVCNRFTPTAISRIEAVMLGPFSLDSERLGNNHYIHICLVAHVMTISIFIQNFVA